LKLKIQLRVILKVGIILKNDSTFGTYVTLLKSTTMYNTKIPAPGEYPKFYHSYIVAVPSDDLLTNFREIHQSSLSLFGSYPENKWHYRYAEDKWHVKELLGHLCDAERIFSTRALRFARNDQTPLPGFEQNDYVSESNVEHRSVPDLLEEWSYLRNATIKLFENFTPEMLQRQGTASGWPITVMAIGFVTAGHEKHHQNIFKERYF
jgi:hypothetical protein